jgi:hypothetical protein
MLQRTSFMQGFSRDYGIDYAPYRIAAGKALLLAKIHACGTQTTLRDACWERHADLRHRMQVRALLSAPFRWSSSAAEGYPVGI